MIYTLVMLIICHLIGDYVLQTDFIAKTKGTNWYHLFVHCGLYVVPFIIVFGLSWKILFLFTAHMIVDPLKARWNKITYVQDQLIHYLTMIIYLI